MKTIREFDSKWAFSCCSPLRNHNHQKAKSSTLPRSYLPTYTSSTHETRPGCLKGLFCTGGTIQEAQLVCWKERGARANTTLGTPSRVTGSLLVWVLLSDGPKYPKHLYSSSKQQPIFQSLESSEKLNSNASPCSRAVSKGRQSDKALATFTLK